MFAGVTRIVHHATPHYFVPAISLQHASANYKQHQYTSEQQDYHTHPKYEYVYNVQDSHTGDIKSQHETRDDNDMSNDMYSVKEVDDSDRTVKYITNGQSGLNEDVHHSQSSTQDRLASHYYHH